MKTKIYIISMAILTIIVIISILWTLRKTTMVEEEYYAYNINEFIEIITSEPIDSNFKYGEYEIYFEYSEKIYNKSDNSFTYYNDNTEMNVLFFPKTTDFEDNSKKYLGTVNNDLEIVIFEEFNNNGSYSFIKVYKEEDGTYTTILGENNTIVTFSSSHENLQKNIRDASILVNSSI